MYLLAEVKIGDFNSRAVGVDSQLFSAGVWQNKSCIVAVRDSKYAQIFISQISPFHLINISQKYKVSPIRSLVCGSP